MTRAAVMGVRVRGGAKLATLWRAAKSSLAADTRADFHRFELWTPVFLGAGAATYFALPTEPSVLVAVASAVGVGIVGLLFARLRGAATACALFALGVVAADLRTEFVAAPILDAPLPPSLIVGRVVAIEVGGAGERYLIAPHAIEGVAEAALPARIRINWRGESADVEPGDRVRLRAGLLPPPPPEIPGGFDYARVLYFDRIGAVGYAIRPPRRLPTDDAPRLSERVERLRIAMTQRILAAAPGQGGALVAASVTGMRGAISAESETALRDSGLAHLVAISGLNMALATGLIFFTLRAALALIEPIALHYPIKKWAAFGALAGGAFYLLLSGGDWSALRAVIMTSVALIAIVFDRRALTLRNVALAATIILLAAPESVFQPGFQMSFAAATALVAAFEAWRRARPAEADFSLLARTKRFVFGLVATDIVASSASGPFAVYHFNRIALYGLPANIVAGPLVAFVLMPAAITALALSPMGWDAPLWRLAALGGDGVIAVATLISRLPGDVVTAPQASPFMPMFAALGGLWICLMSGRWRLFGLAPIAIAMLIQASARPAQVVISREGDNVAVLAPAHDAIAVHNRRKDQFAARVWKEDLGLDPDRAATLPLFALADCTDGACRLSVNGRSISVALNPQTAARLCATSDFVIVLAEIAPGQRNGCATPVFSMADSKEKGAAALYAPTNGPLRVVTVRDRRGVRPWSPMDNVNTSE